MTGSSPLTRGKRAPRRRRGHGEGLIPAHAGKTTSIPPCSRTTRAHPRSRGENGANSSTPPLQRGSSPLTRGKHASLYPVRGCERLIPAHAGKTMRSNRNMRMRRAHPRSRGENPLMSVTMIASAGSSPLTRGKQGVRNARNSSLGLIPAHAGKTATPRPLSQSPGAHPRSRGENMGVVLSVGVGWGSSPLTRGKPGAVVLRQLSGGLIPAHAGKTCGRRDARWDRGAHPRSRGENASLAAS